MKYINKILNSCPDTIILLIIMIVGIIIKSGVVSYIGFFGACATVLGRGLIGVYNMISEWLKG